MENNFCRFLSKIGMIDEDTSLTFLKIYNDFYQDNVDINIFELSFQILFTFLNNITNNQKKYMCQNLPLKYYELREKNKKQKLISIIMKNRLKNKINLLKYFFNWINKSKNKKKEIINKDNNNKNKKNNNKNINTFNKNNSSFKKINQNSYNNIYKIPYPNYFSNANVIEDKFNSINNQDNQDNSLDNNLSNKSTNQFFLSNTTKNSNNSGIKMDYNTINNFNYKELNKSSSGDKLLNSKKKKKILNNYRSTNDINSTWGYKEQNELKECTFKPKINNLKRAITPSKMSYNKRKAEIQSRFDKLYCDNEKYYLQKQIKAIELDHLTTKELTFSPNIKNKSYILKDDRKEKFENRIKTYLDIKNKHSDEMQNKLNEEFNKNYSFSPKINNSKVTKSYSTNSIFYKTINDKNESENSSSIPVHARLYEESKLRNRKRLQRKKEIDDYINNLSNSLIKKITVVNYNKINDLYENKEKKIINEKTKNKVQKEEGITFKPFIYKNKFAKNINSNFYERNSRFLEDKEKFINSHKNIENQKKKMSQNEKKEIVKNIIERLYNESKSGTISNNSISCNKYIKSVQGSFTNLHKIDNKINNNFEEYNSVE